ncbi:MAG: 3-deoxy-manno-octulosonate cytidylyltransferase [Rikenellaceae bacterium]
MNRVLAIIPARYGSSRFPGKPLAMLGGMTVIERVYKQVATAVSNVVVATDDERIFAAVKSFGGDVVMTSAEHTSGTDRCCEAYEKVVAEKGTEFDIVINVQGDEPFIAKEQIESLVKCFDSDSVDIATLVKPFEVSDGIDALENPNSPKVVVSKDMCAIYFSRSVIPYLRGVEREEWLKNHTFYKHIGMYGFRSKALKEVTKLPQSSLEIAESLEQLRWIENGYKIGVGTTNIQTIGIDTPEDLAEAEKFLNRSK